MRFYKFQYSFEMVFDEMYSFELKLKYRPRFECDRAAGARSDNIGFMLSSNMTHA